MEERLNGGMEHTHGGQAGRRSKVRAMCLLLSPTSQPPPKPRKNQPCLQLRFFRQHILLQPRHNRRNLLVPLRRQLAAQRRLAPLHLPPRPLAGRRPPRLLRSGRGMEAHAVAACAVERMRLVAGYCSCYT